MTGPPTSSNASKSRQRGKRKPSHTTTTPSAAPVPSLVPPPMPPPMPPPVPASASPTPKNQAPATAASTSRKRAVAAAAAATGPSHGSSPRADTSSEPPTAVLKKQQQAEPLYRTPAFPLAALLWPARGSVSQWEVLPLILMVAAMFRWAAGLWGYSGYQRPPMHGDYEAQRHWMEITAHLPVSQWYFHDLDWWGLDYPPLTAYHSWLLGRIGSAINPAWFALYTSRGSDDPALKVFMRASVIASDFAIYVPAAIVFIRRYSRLEGVSVWMATIALAAVLLQPSLILIDHVHFQYNAVMLGLVLASMSGMLAGRLAAAAGFFVAALAFKQMALYYALPVFFYLLGSCVFPRVRIGTLVCISLATAATGLAVLLPLLVGALVDGQRGIDPRPDLDRPRPRLPLFADMGDHLDPDTAYYPVIEQLVQLVYRIFPFARGLFEDKVANFWCGLNLVVKLRHYPPELLRRGALVATLASALPPSMILFFRPQRRLLPLGLAAAGWGFFLFSYQVHEKSVLLPLMPMTLLLAGAGGLSKDTRAWVGFSNALGAWTLFPLLRRVDLAIPYAVLTLLWAWLLGLPPTSMGAYLDPGQPGWARYGTAVLHVVFYAAMVAWHCVEATVAAPLGKPDLWVVSNVGIGAAGFFLCYLWCFGKLVSESGLLWRKGDGGRLAKRKMKTK